MSIVRFKRAQETSRAHPAFLEPPHPFVTQNRDDPITENAMTHTQGSTGKGLGYKFLGLERILDYYIKFT